MAPSAPLPSNPQNPLAGTFSMSFRKVPQTFGFSEQAAFLGFVGWTNF